MVMRTMLMNANTGGKPGKNAAQSWLAGRRA
uniref:Uncharacterized protein n=1 Tax=Salmonella sp. TaxID=599 RepID=A0A482ETB4_SALSP|nr:hypothetical protein NNIBIDOC_00118 [Salmonella sp.]